MLSLGPTMDFEGNLWKCIGNGMDSIDFLIFMGCGECLRNPLESIQSSLEHTQEGFIDVYTLCMTIGHGLRLAGQPSEPLIFYGPGPRPGRPLGPG